MDHTFIRCDSTHMLSADLSGTDQLVERVTEEKVKHGYFDLSKGATVQLLMGKMDDNVAIITAIEVQRAKRGNGYASEVMARVLEDADDEGVLLTLAVESDGTGLDNEALRKWYWRMGFRPHVESDTTMIRLPKGHNGDTDTWSSVV